MKIEAHHNIVEHRWSMTAQGLMDILPGNQIYFYIANLTAREPSLPKVMIVAHVSKPEHASSMQEMMSAPGRQKSARYRRNATNLILILLLMPFDITRLSSATSKRIGTAK